ncbi:MAG: hypothetical protein KGL53_05810, partial [Elusimicrobia bacterium]|nr:hypothetical protein [Elusimicrobiota bacterium]
MSDAPKALRLALVVLLAAGPASSAVLPSASIAQRIGTVLPGFAAAGAPPAVEAAGVLTPQAV